MLSNRKIIGWSLSHRITAELVCNGLKMALGNLGLKKAHQLLWHSDRGSQCALNTKSCLQNMAFKGV